MFKERQHSSLNPTITIPERDVEVYENGKTVIEKQEATDIPRKVFWNNVIEGATAALTETNDPVYIATGGGAGSYNGLISYIAAGTLLGGEYLRPVPKRQMKF